MKEEKPNGKNDQEPEKISEPVVEYNLKDNRPMNEYFKNITISSLEGMEEETRKYSRSLTPEQRIEFMYFLNSIYYNYEEESEVKTIKPWGDIFIKKAHDH